MFFFVEDIDKIIAGCIRNDRASQEKLYRQFYPGLFALCKKFFEDNHDILTALNNGMMNVLKNIAQYDPAKGTLFNWTYSIVRNAAISQLKSKKNEFVNVEITEQIEQKAQYCPFEELEWNEIYFQLAKLPAATRGVCTLYYIEGFSIKEIAAQLNLSEGTVKWHLSESRHKLKSLFSSNLISKSE